MKKLIAAALGSVAVMVFVACEDKPSVQPDKKEAGSAVPVAVSAAAVPTTPKPPLVTVDDLSVVVSGDRVDFAGPDAKGRLAALLATKPLVSGETLEVDALRETTMPHLEVVVDALHEAKAKGAKVKTAMRDRTLGEVAVLFDHPPASPCAAVATIAKDDAILVWPYSGGTALRYSHGMAGPDMTLGSEGLRKLANACESSIYFISADDSIKWGMVFDLASAAPGGKDGGVAFRPSSAVVLVKPPVPGRKVTE